MRIQFVHGRPGLQETRELLLKNKILYANLDLWEESQSLGCNYASKHGRALCDHVCISLTHKQLLPWGGFSEPYHTRGSNTQPAVYKGIHRLILRSKDYWWDTPGGKGNSKVNWSLWYMWKQNTWSQQQQWGEREGNYVNTFLLHCVN